MGDMASLLQADLGTDPEINDQLRSWLQSELSRRQPWTSIVRHLLTTEGTVWEAPASTFLLSEPETMMQTFGRTAKAFLGEDLTCALCHDDPFSEHTLREAYDFAAFFSGMHVVEMFERWPVSRRLHGFWTLKSWNDVLMLPPNYPYLDGPPGDPLEVARVPGLGFRHATRKDPRKALADWLTHEPGQDLEDHSYAGASRLAQTMAWHLWQRVFGKESDSARGRNWEGPGADAEMTFASRSCVGVREISVFEEMKDDVDGQAFVQGLGAAFIRASYDLPDFYRIICHTQAYQREARSFEDLRSFAGSPVAAPMVRRLRASQLRTILMGLIDSGPWDPFPQEDFPLLLGSEAEHGCPLPLSPGLARWMSNGRPVQLAVSKLGEELGEHPNDDAVDKLFLTILTRRPRPEELQHAKEQESLEDVAWALFNTSEFLFRK